MRRLRSSPSALAVVALSLASMACAGSGDDAPPGTTVTILGLDGAIDVAVVADSFDAPQADVRVADVAQIALGHGHTCVLTRDGNVACCGTNSSGESGSSSIPSTFDRLRVVDGVNARAIAAGDRETCAIVDGGAVSCWGANAHGQLGDGTTKDRATPKLVSGLARVTSIAVGMLGHVCAARDDGTVWCWGSDAKGELGDGGGVDQKAPVLVAGLSSVVEVVAGAVHTCARHDDGHVSCFGGGAFGQLGDGTPRDRSPPVKVASLEHVVQLAAGYEHTCARLADGGVWCWGSNESGALGTGASFDRIEPSPVHVLDHALKLAVGEHQACAILDEKGAFHVKCWGDDSWGELGDGATRVRRRIPVAILTLSDAIELTLGGSHGCARSATGLACFGANGFGQLGDGTRVDHSRPTAVAW